ncbi:low affinity iron permease family protein [Stenotrophomonas rhizophila]|uniref:low affinity iron permease family protein n=1 Tax=Stenotrophomonas rhizophila TaxID=216778 RepID=UPI0010C0EBCA|nr:low affinity iron permease family protein [Stenotrophomonas rhizophila]TKK07236.1 low affinity iron permease family protein [Stenotrophomonas rhizophila]
MSLRRVFNLVARKAAYAAGTPWTFLAAVSIVVLWALSGPVFKFNDTWQLVINTGTTIITFLMVFLIQHSQNADAAAVQIKLDELIRANAEANNELLDLEELDEERLEEIRREYERMAREAGDALERARACHGDGRKDDRMDHRGHDRS